MSQLLYYPAARFSLAGFTSLIITFFLFFFMQALIKSNGSYVEEFEKAPPIIIFEPEQRDETVQRRERVKPLPEPEKEPPIQKFNPADSSAGKVIPVIFTPTKPPVDFPTRTGPVVVTEADLITLFKPPPAYPQRARTLGIEGYVIVEYTVTALGTTRDIRVIESVPPGIFDEASIVAASRFKYQPRVTAGQATAVPGVRNRFTFVLQD